MYDELQKQLEAAVRDSLNATTALLRSGHFRDHAVGTACLIDKLLMIEANKTRPGA